MSDAVFKRLSDIPAEPVKWLWEGRIPLGKLTLLEGEPGIGKSTLALELAARVSRGAPMPVSKDHAVGPSNVVIFSGDDDLADTVRPRLDAAGADVSHIFAINREIDANDIAPLKPALIILDTLSSYVCVSCEREPADVLRKLGQLAADTNAAVVALINTSDKLAETWSPDFYGTPRSVLLMTPVGHGGRRLAVSKSNLRHIPNVHPLVYYFDDDGGQVHIVNWSDGR